MFSLLRKLPRLLVLAALPCSAIADERWAPNAVTGPVNQLDIAGNACGPAALLTSFRCGSDTWMKVAENIPGTSDKSKLLYIIRAHGLRPSTSLKNRNRWSKEGINVEDLNAIAAELAGLALKPPPKLESVLRDGRESQPKLIARIHSRLRNSLKKGFPPVLSLRRYAKRNGHWQAVQSHFVTVVCVPEKVPRGASSFNFTYFDPWGGKKETGSFAIPSESILANPSGEASCLMALIPKANIGKSKIKAGEATAVVPSFLIGRW